MKKLALFDLDGTLLDSSLDFHAALVQTAKYHQLTIPSDCAWTRARISRGSFAILSELSGSAADSTHVADLRDDFLKRYQGLQAEAPIFDGINEMLLALEEHNILFAIATNKPALLARPLLAETPFSRPPHYIICADEAGQPKPAPELLLRAANDLNIAPSDIAYIGDHDIDIRAANSAQMTSILCKWGFLSNEQATAIPDYTIHQPNELIACLS